MAVNPIRGDLPFEVAGETFILNFSVNGLVALEERLGKTVEEIGAMFGENMSLTNLRACFWAGLQEHQEALSERDAGRLMTQLGTKQAAQLVFDAFVAAFPDAERVEDGDAKGPRKRRATGTG